MHMTSQKGAQLRWGSNETLPRASSPSMQPGGKTPASHTAGLARPGPRTERLSANAPLPAQHVRAARTLDWRRCYGDVDPL